MPLLLQQAVGRTVCLPHLSELSRRALLLRLVVHLLVDITGVLTFDVLHALITAILIVISSSAAEVVVTSWYTSILIAVGQRRPPIGGSHGGSLRERPAWRRGTSCTACRRRAVRSALASSGSRIAEARRR